MLGVELAEADVRYRNGNEVAIHSAGITLVKGDLARTRYYRRAAIPTGFEYGLEAAWKQN